MGRTGRGVCGAGGEDGGGLLGLGLLLLCWLGDASSAFLGIREVVVFFVGYGVAGRMLVRPSMHSSME